MSRFVCEVMTVVTLVLCVINGAAIYYAEPVTLWHISIFGISCLSLPVWIINAINAEY